MSYDRVVAEAARATAQQLTPYYGPRLEAQVEAALHNAKAKKQPDQFVDPTAVGSLIVSIATLAWQVYNDLKKPGEEPTRDKLTRRIRIERRTHTDLAASEEKIIEIVSVEIVKLSSETNDH